MRTNGIIALITGSVLFGYPAKAMDISVSCQITTEQTFTKSSLGTSEAQRNPLTTETFTITDSGIKGYPNGETTPDKAVGSDYRRGIKQSVEIDRHTGALKKMTVGDPQDGVSISIFEDGTCRKQEGF
jgi:hypothetical protein